MPTLVLAIWSVVCVFLACANDGATCGTSPPPLIDAQNLLLQLQQLQLQVSQLIPTQNLRVAECPACVPCPAPATIPPIVAWLLAIAFAGTSIWFGRLYRSKRKAMQDARNSLHMERQLGKQRKEENKSLQLQLADQREGASRLTAALEQEKAEVRNLRGLVHKLSLIRQENMYLTQFLQHYASRTPEASPPRQPTARGPAPQQRQPGFPPFGGHPHGPEEAIAEEDVEESGGWSYLSEWVGAHRAGDSEAASDVDASGSRWVIGDTDFLESSDECVRRFFRRKNVRFRDSRLEESFDSGSVRRAVLEKLSPKPESQINVCDRPPAHTTRSVVGQAVSLPRFPCQFLSPFDGEWQTTVIPCLSETDSEEVTVHSLCEEKSARSVSVSVERILPSWDIGQYKDECLANYQACSSDGTLTVLEDSGCAISGLPARKIRCIRFSATDVSQRLVYSATALTLLPTKDGTSRYAVSWQLSAALRDEEKQESIIAEQKLVDRLLEDLLASVTVAIS
eukprot:TRINITY_DN9011_c0_g1_i1.p1 TRINITY_DN9011_c0_g1~~TRINITY_DN9011_c0_g1_i1.p1  ORF type:complete len:521 (+),score=83.17 TRINITY_DN9011_c0_g1_i1:36-1565(+)